MINWMSVMMGVRLVKKHSSVIFRVRSSLRLRRRRFD